jgi:hypothetical protein
VLFLSSAGRLDTSVSTSGGTPKIKDTHRNLFNSGSDTVYYQILKHEPACYNIYLVRLRA